MKLVVTCLLVAACASAPPAAPESSPGRAERLAVDGLEAWALADGRLELPNDGQLFAVGEAPAVVGDLLAAAGLARDPIALDIQCLLVKAGDRVLLFDTGMGDGALAGTGHLGSSLARAGVAPVAVTDVFISHAHGDHVGGLLTRSGALAFPAAAIHLSAPEWAALRSAADAESVRMATAIAPKVVPFEPGAQLLPDVRAVATPGHTPGHSAYDIGAPGDSPLRYSGDLVHHQVISVQRPAWRLAVDADHAVASATRLESLTALAAASTRLFVPHFPFPGLGTVAPTPAGFAWHPAP